MECIEEHEENFTIQMVIAICMKIRTLKNQGMEYKKELVPSVLYKDTKESEFQISTE